VIPHAERCACGSQASWARRYVVHGTSGPAQTPTVYAGCTNPTHRDTAVGQPVGRDVYEAVYRDRCDHCGGELPPGPPIDDATLVCDDCARTIMVEDGNEGGSDA
jgi:hypothetical protein